MKEVFFERGIVRLSASIYARVPTKAQTTGDRMSALCEAANRADWEIGAEFVSEDINGTKRNDKRPQFDTLSKVVICREVGLVIVMVCSSI